MNPTLARYEFCSMICQTFGGIIAKKNNGKIVKPMAVLTDVERQAIVDARFQFAGALDETGLMKHFENLSPDVIDKLITAVVIGFQASVHRQLSKGEIPF